MVWNSTQSALYKAVDDYNMSVISGENCREKTPEKMPENYAQKMPEKITGNCSKNNCDSEGKNCANFREKCAEKSAEKSPKFTENVCKNCPKNDSLSRLFSDRDFLLVAGLILVLMNEKADFKLILALVIVLLG